MSKEADPFMIIPEGVVLFEPEVERYIKSQPRPIREGIEIIPNSEAETTSSMREEMFYWEMAGSGVNTREGLKVIRNIQSEFLKDNL